MKEQRFIFNRDGYDVSIISNNDGLSIDIVKDGEIVKTWYYIDDDLNECKQKNWYSLPFMFNDPWAG